MNYNIKKIKKTLYLVDFKINSKISGSRKTEIRAKCINMNFLHKTQNFCINLQNPKNCQQKLGIHSR